MANNKVATVVDILVVNNSLAVVILEPAVAMLDRPVWVTAANSHHQEYPEYRRKHSEFSRRSTKIDRVKFPILN